MSSTRTSSSPRATTASLRWGRRGWVTNAVEVAVAVTVVVLDVLLPTLVILAMWAVSGVWRREGAGAVGLRRPRRPARMVGGVLLLSVLWTGLVFGLVTPVVEQLSGSRRDVGRFVAVEGDLPLLLVMLAVSWTLAAVGEELAYRGYLMARVRALVRGPAGPLVAAVASSVLFGLAHTEQGVAGVVLTTLDGLLFSAVRLHYGTVWASVLAHGTINTIGLAAYFLAGPVASPW